MKLTSQNVKLMLQVDGLHPEPVEIQGYVEDSFDKPRLWRRIVWVGITETEFECEATNVRFNIRTKHDSETYKALSALRPTVESPFSIEGKSPMEMMT